MQVGFIVILIIAIFVAIFAIQNGDMVTLDLFLTRVQLPLAVIIMACIIIGAVIVLLLGTTRQFKKRSESKEIKNKLKILEGDKMLADNSMKEMETELQTIKDENTALTAKISELEEKNNTQIQTIEKLSNELDSMKAASMLIESNIKNEGAETENYDEKSEAQSE